MKNKSISFQELSADILEDKLLPYLTMPDLAYLVNCSRETQALFKPSLIQSQVKTLLQLVAYGEQDKVEAILQKAPYLLLEKGNVTDYSLRVFKNISAFQYAIWAKDSYMWAMMLAYFLFLEQGLNRAKEQFNQIESSGVSYIKNSKANKIVATKERHFDFKPLMNALDHYIKEFNNAEISENKRIYWCNVVGSAQQDLPAHIAQHYCAAEDSFNPTPNFKKLAIRHKPTLHMTVGQQKTATEIPPETKSVIPDYFAIHSLFQIRTIDIVNLRHYLVNPANNPLPSHLQHQPVYITHKKLQETTCRII